MNELNLKENTENVLETERNIFLRLIPAGKILAREEILMPRGCGTHCCVATECAGTAL
jgi:hypothetical protein